MQPVGSSVNAVCGHAARKIGNACVPFASAKHVDEQLSPPPSVRATVAVKCFGAMPLTQFSVANPPHRSVWTSFRLLLLLLRPLELLLFSLSQQQGFGMAIRI